MRFREERLRVDKGSAAMTELEAKSKYRSSEIQPATLFSLVAKGRLGGCAGAWVLLRSDAKTGFG